VGADWETRLRAAKPRSVSAQEKKGKLWRFNATTLTAGVDSRTGIADNTPKNYKKPLVGLQKHALFSKLASRAGGAAAHTAISACHGH
jgi:hypothetical protein